MGNEVSVHFDSLPLPSREDLYKTKLPREMFDNDLYLLMGITFCIVAVVCPMIYLFSTPPTSWVTMMISAVLPTVIGVFLLLASRSSKEEAHKYLSSLTDKKIYLREAFDVFEQDLLPTCHKSKLAESDRKSKLINERIAKTSARLEELQKLDRLGESVEPITHRLEKDLANLSEMRKILEEVRRPAEEAYILLKRELDYVQTSILNEVALDEVGADIKSSLSGILSRVDERYSNYIAVVEEVNRKVFLGVAAIIDEEINSGKDAPAALSSKVEPLTLANNMK